MHLTHDVLKCQHNLDFKTCIMGIGMINAYIIQHL